jgi:adenylate cyclase
VEAAGFLVNYETRQEDPPTGGEVPLLVPATFTHLLGQRVNDKSDQGMRVRLYSEYPFRGRTDAGPQDAFQREAIRTLRERPDQVVYEFSEVEGQPVLRYVKAWVLKPNCLHCHNTHQDSPKRDWKEGEVRGALEITRFLSKDEARVRDGLRGTFVLMGATFGALLGLSVLVLVVGRRRSKV